MAANPLNVLLEDNLNAQLVAFYESRGINRSAGTRDLLRTALGLISDPYDGGWREGYMISVAAIREHVADAISRVPPVC